METYFLLVLWTVLNVISNKFTQCVSDSSSSDKPRYMEIFSKHQHWEGNYMYNSSMYYCYLYAHSEHYLKKDLLLATFRDKRGVTIELEGLSPGLDDLEVKFTVHVMFHHDDRFPVNFTLQGRLTQDALSEWNYNAEITPQGKFGHFKLQQSDSNFGPSSKHDDKNSWRYFAIIGVPVILAVIGVAGTVAIIYWAIRKGYIRHVPKSYDHFRNPVRFENTGDTGTAGNEAEGGGNVHI